MKTDKIKVYVLEFILLAILSFTLFVSNMFIRENIAIVLVIACLVISYFLKKRKTESIHYRKVITLLVIFSVIYLIAFYLMGMFFGFVNATVKFSIDTIFKYIIPMAIIIVASEGIRRVLISQNTKFSKAITLVIMVLIDLIIYADIYNMKTFDKFAEIIGFVFFASVACNLLYNYIAVRYGILGNIIYRLITVLYVYFIPVIPNVHVFFRSILRMVYPYVIYQILEYTFTVNKSIEAEEDKRKNIISKVVLGFITLVLAMLISCQFKYGILVIGSGSMTGTINKGDAVFYERYDRDKDIEESDVIIFRKNDKRIVHRVVDIKTVNGEKRYITKGDANTQNDDSYITDEDIMGVTKFKILYIGYPSIWVREMFVNKNSL